MKRAKYLVRQGHQLPVSERLNYFFYENIKKNNYLFHRNELLKNFSRLDDDDIFYSLKSFEDYDDQVLSFLASSILHRKLFRLEFFNKKIKSDLVKRIRQEVATTRKLTKKELKSLLGVNDCVIKWLCDEGYLPLRKSRSPTSRKSRSVVRQADLDSFNRQYITLRNLARQSRFNSYRLKSMLKQASVAPLDGTNQHGRNIYAIRDVGHILPTTNVGGDVNGPEQKT